MQTIWFVLAAIAGVILGFWLGMNFLKHRNRQLSADLNESKEALAKAKAESESRASFEALATERQALMTRLEEERNALREELRVKASSELAQAARISQLEADLRNERQNLAEKLALLDTAKKALSDQFEALAANILEKKTKTFSDANKDELETILKPLREQIKDFRDKVEKVQTDSNEGVTTIKTLIGDLSGLNQQLSKEAHNLTNALLGSSSDQGQWGEEIARDLLELGGLREGVQYRAQQTVEANAGDEEGRQRNVRPDIIVSLPGGRNLIIDSKVSLTAYYESVKAESDAERKTAIKKHLTSVRKHVDELAAKAYHRLQAIESPDFVVMFVPIEPAFLVAIHEDGKLWHYAYEKHILLVGPTTLLFIIRIVDNLWRQELQVRSVKDVIKRGTALYEKFAGFVADIEAIGKNLRSATESYEDAKSKLSTGSGNLIRQVEMLKQLGIRTGKSLPSNLLDAADVEESGLALAAEADKTAETK